MPSVHVAIATLNAFYLARLNRWLGVAGWAFAIFILFGSVYTGWHYAAPAVALGTDRPTILQPRDGGDATDCLASWRRPAALCTDGLISIGVAANLC